VTVGGGNGESSRGTIPRSWSASGVQYESTMSRTDTGSWFGPTGTVTRGRRASAVHVSAIAGTTPARTGKAQSFSGFFRGRPGPRRFSA
jgi:hypothetical protein